MTDIIGNKTLRDMWEEADALWSEDPFLIYEDCEFKSKQYNYHQFYENIIRTANLFLSLGVKKGDCVAVQLPNSPEFVMCWFGLAQIGAILVPLNPQYRDSECDYILGKCLPKLVILDYKLAKNHIGNRVSSVEYMLSARSSNDVEGFINFNKEIMKQSVKLLERPPLSSEDTAEFLFTSGTTSRPKGVIITHCNSLYAGMIHAGQCGLRRKERFFTAMPCFHIDFQLMAVMSCLVSGGTVVVSEHYSASNFWRQVCQYKANVTDLMPFHIRTIMKQPVQSWEKDHCVRQSYFSMGMSTEEKNEFEERFNVRLLNCYGSTETISCVTADPETGLRRWPSVGRPAMGYEIRIVDSEGNELPAGKSGDIQVYGIPGRTLMRGYYDEPEYTASVFTDDGWFKTCDTGYIDEDGWLYFVDRDSTLIKSSGENISSTEIENVLTEHPEIMEAAVFGIPDPLRNQVVKAMVKLKESSTLKPEDIRCYCQLHLAKFKIPSVVEIVDDFPRTCTGKIKKQLLR